MTVTKQWNNGTGQWEAITTGVPGPSSIPIKTTSSTAVTGDLTDTGFYIRFTGTNPVYTVPPNSSVAFPVGTIIQGVCTVSAMSITPGSGVTITKARTTTTVGSGSGWTLIKHTTDGWDLHGDLV